MSTIHLSSSSGQTSDRLAVCCPLNVGGPLMTSIFPAPSEGRLFARIVIALSVLGLLSAPVAGLAKHATQRAHPARSRTPPTAKRPAAARPLVAGAPVVADIAAGAVHAYRFELGRGEAATVEVSQETIDLELTLVGPRTTLTIEVDGTVNPAPEYVDFVAKGKGGVRLEIRPRDAGIGQGRYRVTLSISPAPDARSRALAEGFARTATSRRLYKGGEFTKALAESDRALEAYAAAGISADYRLLATLGVRVLVQTELAEHAGSVESARRAIACAESVAEAEDPNIANARVMLGQALTAAGDLDSARAEYDRALPVLRSALGERSVSTAMATANLGVLEYMNDRLAEAETLYVRALEVLEPALPAGDPVVVGLLQAIGVLYRDMNLLPKSEQFYMRALKSAEVTLGTQHPDYAYILNGIGVLYGTQRDYRRAISFFDRAYAIRWRRLGRNHPLVGSTLDNLAFVYRILGNNVRAERFSLRALEIARAAPDRDPLSLALREFNLGTLYALQGRFRLAIPYYKSAREVRERAIGPYAHSVGMCDQNLAVAYYGLRDFKQAIECQRSACDIFERDYAANYFTGSEEEKLERLAGENAPFASTLSMSVLERSSDRRYAELGFETAARHKGRALDLMFDAFAAARARSSAEDRVLFDQLATARERLAALTLYGSRAAGGGDVRGLLATAEAEVGQLEAEICALTPEYGSQIAKLSTASVRAALPDDGACLLEYVRFEPVVPYGRTGRIVASAPRYAVFVVRREGPVRAVDLGPAATIDSAAEAVRAALRDPGGDDDARRARSTARALDRLVLDPVRGDLAGVSQVLVSPDGPLTLIPFAALIDPDGRYEVQTREFSYLTSGRDLLRFTSRVDHRQPPIVLADPNYGAGPGPRFGLLAFDMLKQLPGTAREGERVRELFPAARLLTGADATKAEVARVDRPYFLHLATHGFFLDAEAVRHDLAGAGIARIASRVDTRPGSPHAPTLGDAPANPLLRCGVFLAGANGGQSSGERSILTGLEIAGLDLWGTRLVVLSACDTGLGEVRSGEGVLGLRRALVLAGSETQIIALWPVKDLATSGLMDGFYTGLASGIPRARALCEAQRRILDASGGRAHPALWAGFILSGRPDAM